jgi:hypothetical protein
MKNQREDILLNSDILNAHTYADIGCCKIDFLLG